MMFNPKATTTVVQVGEPMSEKELDSALLSITPLSLRALLQLIDTFRQEHAASAARQATVNNPLAMASDNGVYEGLSGLIAELSDRCKPDAG